MSFRSSLLLWQETAKMEVFQWSNAYKIHVVEGGGRNDKGIGGLWVQIHKENTDLRMERMDGPMNQ